MGGGVSRPAPAPAPAAAEAASGAPSAAASPARSAAASPAPGAAPPPRAASPARLATGPTPTGSPAGPHLLAKTPSGRFRRSSLVVETKKAMSSLTEDGLDMINQYVLLEELGRGAFARVRRAATEEGEFAVKVVDKRRLRRIRLGPRECALDRVMQEVAVWKLLEHPNVVQLLEVIDDEESDSLYLVSEIAAGGALRGDMERTEPMRESEARRHFQQLLDG